MIFLTGGAFTTSARNFLADALKEQSEKPFDSANLRRSSSATWWAGVWSGN